jgi:hypothetical protein
MNKHEQEQNSHVYSMLSEGALRKAFTLAHNSTELLHAKEICVALLGRGCDSSAL